MCAELTDYSFTTAKYDPEPYFKILQLYFSQQINVHVKHHTESFRMFVEEIIPNIINGEHTILEKITEDKVIRHKLEFTNLAIKPPYIETDKRLMFPIDAIHHNLNYFSKCTATITQWEEVINLKSGAITSRNSIGSENDVPFAKIPILVGSKYCNLSLNPSLAKNHCPWDHGGYFIVNGSEKVVLSIETGIPRKPIVSISKEPNFNSYYVKVDSRPDTQMVGNVQKFALKIKKDNSIVLAVLYFKEVSVFTLMRALGLESDEDIIYSITDPSNKAIYNQLLIAMNTPNSPSLQKDDAIKAMVNAMRTTKVYTETNKELREQQKQKHLMRVLTHILLPHVTSGTNNEALDMRCKAYFIGLMINKLLKCYLKQNKTDDAKGCDDRDSLFNKRVELTGVLLGTLFEQSFKKLISDCSRSFKSKSVEGNKSPYIVPCVKSNQVEQTLRQALSTGNFGTPTKKGISQALSRINYDQSLTYVKRVVTPMADASSKLTGPRFLHNTQYGSLCPLETPEGQKTGVLKNLSMIGTIACGILSQIPVIRKILNEMVIPLISQKCRRKLYAYVKVFLNGNWIGMSIDVITLYNRLRELRFKGEIDKTVSLVINYSDKEFYVYTDSGRFIRPYLTVTNNELNFKPEMINGVTSWDDLLSQYPHIIEFVDKEEEQNMMLAMFPTDIEYAKSIMNRPAITDKKKLNMINQTNRYDDNIFVRYTHCEIHPSMLLGAISINIPFPNHNQSPRGIYHYSQRKQAMGLYASNYHHRIDNSYLLYHLQIPIVASRTTAFTNSHVFPCGENAIVAIASYYGFNQDDSIGGNRTAVELGFLRATSHKKQKEEIKKNPAASQTGMFMKPDPNKVSGVKKDANYEKITESGYAKENTYIENGDVIIGIGVPKPISPNDEKAFKDGSVIYKSLVPGAIDKIIVGTNNEDYPLIKLRIRQERILNVGDKLACYDDQTEILTNRGFVMFKNLNKNDLVGSLSENRLTFERPSDIHVYDHKGTMYYAHNETADIMVTHNHKMYVSDGNSYTLKQVNELNSKDIYHMTTAQVDKCNVPGILSDAYSDYNFSIVHFSDFVSMIGLISFSGTMINGNELIVYLTTEYAIDSMKIWTKLFGIMTKHDDVGKILVITDNRVINLVSKIQSTGFNTLVHDSDYYSLVSLLRGIKMNTLRTGSSDIIVDNMKHADLIQTMMTMVGEMSVIDYDKSIEMFVIRVFRGNRTVIESYKKVEYNGKVYCCTVESGVICVRRNGKILFCGNSRSAQKGTIGILSRRTNMPYTKKGIVPQIVINPNCIPKRMTIGQLIETLLGKVCAIKGIYGDSTPFMGVDIHKINEELKSLGYEEWGNETMYDGVTGNKIGNKIFIGPTYYHRLKQMVGDKAHSRLGGQTQLLTHAPPEGLYPLTYAFIVYVVGGRTPVRSQERG